MSPDLPGPPPSGTYHRPLPAAPDSGAHRAAGDSGTLRPIDPETGRPMERRAENQPPGTAVMKSLTHAVGEAAAGAAAGTLGLRGTWFQLANTSALVLFGFVFLWQFRMQAEQQRDDRAYYREQIRLTQTEADRREAAMREADGTRTQALVAEMRANTSKIDAVAAEMRAVRVAIEAAHRPAKE